jgi:hypothetical protein
LKWFGLNCGTSNEATMLLYSSGLDTFLEYLTNMDDRVSYFEEMPKRLAQADGQALLDEGYQGAMLYVAQHTASLQRYELFRILTICQLNKIPSLIASDLIAD